MLLSLNHLLWQETRVFNLVEKLSRFLLDIDRGLGLEAFGFTENFLCGLKGIENNKGFLLFGATFEGLRAVLLPKLFNKFLRFLVLVDTNS